MTLKIDSKLETELTPEEVSEHNSLTTDEKIERITNMKFELERQTGRSPDGVDKHGAVAPEGPEGLTFGLKRPFSLMSRDRARRAEWPSSP